MATASGIHHHQARVSANFALEIPSPLATALCTGLKPILVALRAVSKDWYLVFRNRCQLFALQVVCLFELSRGAKIQLQRETDKGGLENGRCSDF